jgi:hypothetical protein
MTNTSDETFNLFSNKKINFEQNIDLTCRHILNKFRLVINGNEHTIEEIEFYYHSKNHPDEYTHKNKDQLTNQQWYFHKYNNGTLKNGTYKGLDMTIGDNNTIYGGILTRTIKNVSTGELIIGPCRVVDYMIKKNNVANILELSNKFNNYNIFNDNNCVHIKINSRNNNNDFIFNGPRVGLSLKYPEYLFKKYRYLKNPNKIPKYKNTIVGTLHDLKMTSEQIHNLTSMGLTVIGKAIIDFDSGKTMSADEILKYKNSIKLTTTDINKLYGYYSNKK